MSQAARKEIHRISDKKEREKRKEKRKKALEFFGSRCKVCGGTKYLELQHLTYRNGNPYKEYKSGSAYIRTLKEVFKDPTNFVLLCHQCHLFATLYTSEQIRELASYVTSQEQPKIHMGGTADFTFSAVIS